MGMDRGCPGQDRSNWTPDDIFEVECAGCGHLVEFYKDDARRYCPSCGACILNPKQDIGCAAWCAAAEKCSVGRQWIEDDADDQPTVTGRDRAVTPAAPRAAGGDERG